jgi:hypothetical protein
MKLEIGSKGHAAVLDPANDAVLASLPAVKVREDMIYNSISAQASLSGEDYKVLDTIEKNRDRRLEKQQKEDTHANSIIAIIQKMSGEEPTNIVNMHNKVMTLSPLKRVILMLKSFDEEYKGTIFTARKEYDALLTDIKVANTRDDLPNRVQLIENIRIECASIYPEDPLNPLAIRGYSSEELVHTLLERISTDVIELIAIREKITEAKKRKQSWAQIKHIITDDFKDNVKSLDCKNKEVIKSAEETKIVATAQKSNNIGNGPSVCFYFRDKGFCRYGKNCIFSHDIHSHRDQYNNRQRDQTSRSPDGRGRRQHDDRGRESRQGDRRKNDQTSTSHYSREKGQYDDQKKDFRQGDRSRKEDKSPSREWSRSRSRSEERDGNRRESNYSNRKGPSTPYRKDIN